MEEVEEANKKKRKSLVDIDWRKLLPDNQVEEEPPQLVVVPGVSKPPDLAMGGGDHVVNDLSLLSDSKLEDDIARIETNYRTLSNKLPDKGQKLFATIRKLQEEKERRKCPPLLLMDNGGGEKPLSRNPCINGVSRGLGQGAPSSMRASEFGSSFRRHMVERTGHRTADAFENEIIALGRCGKGIMGQNEQFLSRGKYGSARQTDFQSLKLPSVDLDEQNVSNDVCEGRQLSPASPPNIEGDIPYSFSKSNNPKVQPSRNSRTRSMTRNRGQTVFIVDEEDTQLEDKIQQEDKTYDHIKEMKIYFPTRDDPESVEICYADLQCLAPETYLSSTIMNFYIRYLQRPISVADRNYHFFTTYFYEKLKEAVIDKMSDKENLFSKFRRWWKGVNIFEKAYILLPINEDHHWSLVIICIPDKDDETGPILLHLDSLGLHSSRSIFKNVKSFLKKEWDYLNQQEASSKYPIADRIWKMLPRRIEEKTIQVPQQKNEYDCGLFVLFFMERFIEEAPERLKKKDLAMFGKQWFNPKEASDLRPKLKNLLKEKFREESETKRPAAPDELERAGNGSPKVPEISGTQEKMINFDRMQLI